MNDCRDYNAAGCGDCLEYGGYKTNGCYKPKQNQETPEAVVRLNGLLCATYTVDGIKCNCHPETCGHADYVLFADYGNGRRKVASGDNGEELEKLALLANRK